MATLISEVQSIPRNSSTIKLLRNPLYKRHRKNKEKENKENKENKEENNNNNKEQISSDLPLHKVDFANEQVTTSQYEKKKEVKTTVDRLLSTLSHSNQIGSVLNSQLRSISRDVTAMQEMADLLESEKQTEFTSIVQVYNRIIQDVCHFSINQRCVINKVMISIDLNDKEMFLSNLEQLDVTTCKKVLHDITDFSTLLTNFVASLKITKSKIYKDWKFWLGATIGGISAVAAVLTLGLAFWVEVGIAAGLLAAGALVGTLSIWGVISSRTNKRRVHHLNDLKETLKRADSHLIQVKGVVTKIGDQLDYFIEQMFHNPQFKEIIEKTMEIFTELDGLLGHQVC